jgi:hypothetical protein
MHDLFIITKNDIFYQMNIYDEENILSFILNNDNSILDKMLVKEFLYHKPQEQLYHKFSKKQMHEFVRNND